MLHQVSQYGPIWTYPTVLWHRHSARTCDGKLSLRHQGQHGAFHWRPCLVLLTYDFTAAKCWRRPDSPPHLNLSRWDPGEPEMCAVLVPTKAGHLNLVLTGGTAFIQLPWHEPKPFSNLRKVLRLRSSYFSNLLHIGITLATSPPIKSNCQGEEPNQQ